MNYIISVKRVKDRYKNRSSLKNPFSFELTPPVTFIYDFTQPGKAVRGCGLPTNHFRT